MQTTGSVGESFVRGVHFFGTASPLNFWDSSLTSEIDSFFARFREDGFNTVLLVVPWAHFQPSTQPVGFCSQSFSRLEAIFDAAAQHDLGVVLRLGYLWEAKPVLDQTYRRYNEYSMREDLRTAWKVYLREFYRLASSKPNFVFAFLSWEDFYWPIFSAGSTGPLPQRVQRSRVIGFRDYLRRRFSLSGLNSIYGLKLTSWNELAIPQATDFLYEQYIRFYENELLDPLCCAAVESFPGIRMEMRVDPEWINSQNSRKFYHWSMNFPGASTKVIYYHANIARSHTHEHGSLDAVHHLRDLLSNYCRMVELGEKRPFIDQFNFFDDTYSKWTRISEDAVPHFIEDSADILRKFSSGYAIWGYQDWAKDIVFNGGFELGSEGWRLEKGASIINDNATSKIPRQFLKLAQGQSARQSDFVLKLPADEPRVVAIKGTPVSGTSARISVEYNDATSEITLTGDKPCGSVSFTADGDTDSRNLVLTAIEGAALISRVQVYSRYHSQGFRTKDGQPRPAVEAFQALNRKLSD